jgi:hypothetical protein
MLRNVIVLIGLFSFTGRAADPLRLGALEELPSFFADQPLRRAVRLLFEKTDRGWGAVPNNCLDENCLKTISARYPSSVTWTIAFSGRNLGHVTAETYKTYDTYAEVGVQKIISSGPIPTIGPRSYRYGGETMAQDVFRPLVAISQPNVADPDDWHPDEPSVWLVDLVRGEFRKKFPKATNCRKPDGPESPWRYSNSNIKLSKAYASRKGWHLLALEMIGDRCSRPPGESVTLNQWYAVSPLNEVRYTGEGLWLVDAGDYDNDGKSEVLFAVDIFNRGGYELFYDDFKGHARFEYGYH